MSLQSATSTDVNDSKIVIEGSLQVGRSRLNIYIYGR